MVRTPTVRHEDDINDDADRSQEYELSWPEPITPEPSGQLADTSTAGPETLEGIRAARSKVSQVLSTWRLAAGIGLAVGGVGGKITETAFVRSSMIDPAPIVSTHTGENTPQKKSSTKDQDLLDAAEEAFVDAANATVEVVTSLAEQTKLLKWYREQKREMIDAYNRAIKSSGNVLFWLTFLSLFSATTLLAQRVIKGAKDLKVADNQMIVDYLKLKAKEDAEKKEKDEKRFATLERRADTSEARTSVLEKENESLQLGMGALEGENEILKARLAKYERNHTLPAQVQAEIDHQAAAMMDQFNEVTGEFPMLELNDEDLEELSSLR